MENNLLSQIHFINEEIKRLTKEKNQLVIHAVETDHLKEDEYYLEILKTTRVSIDKDKLQEEYPEIYEKVKKETPSYRKTVKVDKEVKESKFAQKIKESSKPKPKGDKSWRILM